MQNQISNLGNRELLLHPVHSRSKWLIIAIWGLLALILIFGWWKSSERHRQIELWSQVKNSSALLSFVQEHLQQNDDKAEVAFAFQKFRPLAGDKDLVQLEALFYQLAPGDEIGLGIFQIFKKQNREFHDSEKAVAWWISNGSHAGRFGTEMPAMLARMPKGQVQGAFLAEIGRRYANGDKPGAIEAAHRYGEVPPAPGAADLASLLGSYSDAEDHVYQLQQRIPRLDSKIEEQKEVVGRYHFVTLSAFLVDRIPNIGDNVYEIATFSWSDYTGFQRNETGILTCIGTTFNSKGRFTMIVKPTGMKTFGRNNGGSVDLPTFEEASRSELAEKGAAERELLELILEKQQTKKEIANLEEEMVQYNAAIKGKLGWNGNLVASNDAIQQTDSVNNDEKDVKSIFESWIEQSQIKGSDISCFYAETVDYYNVKKCSKVKLIKDKSKFWGKYTNLKLTTSNIEFAMIDQATYKVTYNKKFEAGNDQTDKNYNGKVRSVAIFEKIDNKWAIVTEKDIKNYNDSKD